MRFLALLPIRNEADRYLSEMLVWHSWIFDGIAVYDDQSTDRSADIARRAGAAVAVRPDGVPSFLEHEGRFRQAAWAWMEAAFHPDVDDWIFAIDADEFLVCLGATIPTTLFRSIWAAEDLGYDCVEIPVPEVFRVDEKGPQIRRDGFWGGLASTRLVRYQRGATYADQPMACGQVPAYATEPLRADFGLRLLHYGYATQADREAKYERYSSIAHNHNPRHIASILQPPVLEPWPDDAPLLKKSE